MQGSELGKNRVTFDSATQIGVLHQLDFRPQQRFAGLQPHFTADFCGNDFVIAGQDFHSHTVLGQGGNRLGSTFFGWVQEGQQALHGHLAFVLGLVTALGLFDRNAASGDQQDTEAVRVVAVGHFQQTGTLLGIQWQALITILHVGGNAEHFFHRTFAHHQLFALGVLYDNRQATPHKVKRQFVYLAVGADGLQGRGCFLGKAQHGLIHQIFHTALVQAVEQGQFQNAWAVAIIQTQMVLQNDAVLCQGAGLVGAQHVHGTKVLDRVQTFDHHLVLGHGHRAFGQVGGHNHGQHFRGQAHGNGQCEQEGFGPVAFGKTVDQQHDRHHDQHEANQQPADAVHAPVKRGLGARTHNGLGQRSKIGPGAGGNDDGRGCAADHVGAHKAHIVLFQHAGLGAGRRGTFAADCAKDIVLFDRQGFTR